MDRQTIENMTTQVQQHHENVVEIAETIRHQHGEHCAATYLITVAHNELFGQMLSTLQSLCPFPPLMHSLIEKFGEAMSATISELLRDEDDATLAAMGTFIEQATKREVELMKNLTETAGRAHRRDH